MAVTPRSESEVILNYDRETEQWHLYSDVPSLNRKWQDKVLPESLTVEDNGTISKIDGYLLDNCSVSIRKQRELTDEQRKQLSDRAKSNFGH